METELTIGGAELLPRIEPLWCELRDVHSSRSAHFSEMVEDMEFESRRLGLMGKSVGGHIMVQVMSLSGTSGQKDIAYCVSTVGRNGIAEITRSMWRKDTAGWGWAGSSLKGQWTG